MELELNKVKIEKVRDEINLFLWNNNYPTESMQFTNEILEQLENIKIKVEYKPNTL